MFSGYNKLANICSGGFKMTFAMILRTAAEIAVFAAVIWCIFHEDRLAAFEKRLLCTLRRKRLRLTRVEHVTPDI